MYQHGPWKETEFTRKQINVIFAKAKAGDLRVEKWFISQLYALAEYNGYDSNGSIAQDEWEVKKILKAVFAGDNVEAQVLINSTADRWYSLFSRKNQLACNRKEFV